MDKLQLCILRIRTVRKLCPQIRLVRHQSSLVRLPKSHLLHLFHGDGFDHRPGKPAIHRCLSFGFASEIEIIQCFDVRFRLDELQHPGVIQSNLI